MKLGILGIYYGNNLMQEMVAVFEAAGVADNLHLLCLDGNVPNSLRPYTKEVAKGKKFALLNTLSRYVIDCDYIIVTDDDIAMPSGFFPGYLETVLKHRFDLAQPALTKTSHFSHQITVQQQCAARLTTFVEIGPMFSMKKEFFHNNLPFPATMGHGLDYWWSVYSSVRGYRMGIVDEFAVEHSYRPVGKNYSSFDASKDMLKLMTEKNLRVIPEQRTLATYL
jgi:hypothetical protein